MSAATSPPRRVRPLTFILGSILALIVIGGPYLTYRIERTKLRGEAERAVIADAVEVVFATRELPRGVPIAAADLVVRIVQSAAAPQDGVFHEVEEVVNRTPKETVLAGEPVRIERLADQRAASGLNAIIKERSRAVTLPVPSGTLAPDQVRVGNYVDIDVFLPRSAGGPVPSGACVIEELRVLLLDTAAPGFEMRAPAWLTVEAGAEEATLLAQALADGRLFVELRSDTDIFGSGRKVCVERG